MADTILSGRWVINYEAENRQKRIWRDTAITPTVTDTVNALYSALQNHFDELTQMDDGVPMSAQTPTEYTIGIIDAGDVDPWFVDRTSVEYLTGGALKTASWDRVEGTNTGIVRIEITESTAFDPTDIGRDIIMTIDGDRGTLLDYNNILTEKVIWVRPDTNAAANSFDNAPTNGGAWTLASEDASQVWQIDDPAGTPAYLDETIDFTDVGAGDVTPFPAGDAIGDQFAIGFRQKFAKVTYTVGTAGVGGLVDWKYWNGSTWSNLSGGSTASEDLLATGARTLTFTVPSDWTAKSINGSQSLYYIVAQVTDVYETDPILDIGAIGTTGVGSQVNTAGGGDAVSAGESLWANIYSIGTIESNTHLYIQQNALNLTAYKAATDWWGDGHVDLLVNVKELGTETDEGYIKVFARQYSKSYSYYSVDLTAGGRNPIPLQTGNDLDNQTGYWSIIGSGATGTFVAGETISKSGTNKKGKITAVTGSPGATPTIYYYLVGDPLTNFENGDTSVTGDTSLATTTIATGPTAYGPSALGSPPTITFGGLATGGSADIDENGTAENYSITLDCNQNSLANVYEYTKYITRRGATADIDAGAQTIEGQFYLGTEYRLKYTGSPSGAINDGDSVTQETSGATGIIVNHNTTDKIIMLRNTRGTFATHATTHTLTDTTTSQTVEIDSEATAVTPVTAAPFGTFAGGTFFVATGVLLSDYITTEANNFQLKTDEGTVVEAPTKVTISVGNTRAGDKVGVFRLTAASGTIVKNRYYATAQSALATSAIITSGGQSGSATITADEPGIASGGVIRLVDTSASTEYRIRFSSWSASTFILANQSGTMDDTSGTTTTTNLHDDGKLFLSTNLVKVGDLVINTSLGNAVAYVTVVVDDENLTISPAITGQASGNTYQINALPVATTISPQDTWYVPMLDVYETTGAAPTGGTETAIVTYLADIPVRVRARNAGNIIPYEADSTVTTTGMSNSIIRTADTIFT